MSVWTEIKGTVSIYKKDKVSIKRVIEDTLTYECVADIETSQSPDSYTHKIDARVCLDGPEFIDKVNDFIESLKAIPGTLDLTCELRFFG